MHRLFTFAFECRGVRPGADVRRRNATVLRRPDVWSFEGIRDEVVRGVFRDATALVTQMRPLWLDVAAGLLMAEGWCRLHEIHSFVK